MAVFNSLQFTQDFASAVAKSAQTACEKISPLMLNMLIVGMPPISKNNSIRLGTVCVLLYPT